MSQYEMHIKYGLKTKKRVIWKIHQSIGIPVEVIQESGRCITQHLRNITGALRDTWMAPYRVAVNS